MDRGHVAPCLTLFLIRITFSRSNSVISRQHQNLKDKHYLNILSVHGHVIKQLLLEQVRLIIHIIRMI